jgi:thiamine pyrophosphokinase
MKGRVFIILNGVAKLLPDITPLVGHDDRIICVDGGTNHAHRMGLLPNLIIGDLDSIDPMVLHDYENKGVSIKKYPRDKEASDLELAIQEALTYEPSELWCFCTWGGRPDHALTNINVLGHYAAKGLKISIFDESWLAQYVTKDYPAKFSGQVQDTLSLIPLTPTVEGVQLTGTRWPLDNATLEWGKSLTLSNEFAQPDVTVVVSEGLLIAFHIKDDQRDQFCLP